MLKKVSIIISCYNSAEYIQRSVESALFQTCKDIEVIVVNDASTDSSSEILEKISDERLKVITHSRNKGAGIARKTGIENAYGEYVFFLDSDDYIEPDMIDVLLKATNTYKDVDIVRSGNILEYPNGDIKGVKCMNYIAYSPKDKYEFFKEEGIVLLGSLIRRNLFSKVSYSDFPYIEDIATYIPLLMAANGVHSISYLGYHYLQHPKSLTHTASTIKNLIFGTLVKCSNFNTLLQYELVDKSDIYITIMKYFHMFRVFKKEILQEYPEWHQKILEISASLPSNIKTH